MSDKLKQLTGKNPKDFEPQAYNLINTPDVELFKELVDKDDFLYDFVKQNVANRLEKNCNKNNYLNLIQLLKFYSPAYENFIINTLSKYADEDLTDTMLDLFENGTISEKTYCAKYFSVIKDTLALECLKKYAFNDDSSLSTNCITALAKFGDRELYNNALLKLKSKDEFEQLEGAKFLVSYGDKSCTNELIETAKYSSFGEHIAAEIPYLMPLNEVIKQPDGLYILNLIINGLGEVSSPAQIFDYELYENLDNLINGSITSKIGVILLNAIDKFETLTENDEYLFDEANDTKQEIQAVKELLSGLNIKNISEIAQEELNQNSLFVYTALEFTNNSEKVRQLLSGDNQTVILKAIEILKKLGDLTPQDKENALGNISDENITNIILAI